MTTSDFIRWIDEKVINIDEKMDNREYRNYQQVNNDLDIVRKEIDRTAKPSKKNASLNGFDAIKRGYLKPTMDESVEDANTSYVSEVSPRISRADNLEDINEISIDERYERNTVNRLRTQLGGRREFFQRRVSVRERDLKGITSQDDLKKYGISSRAGISTLRNTFFGVSDEVLQSEFSRLQREEILR